MIEFDGRDSQDRAHFVEVQIDEHTLFMISQEVGQTSHVGSEVEIAGQESPSLDGALDAVAELARKISGKLQNDEVSKITVEFGCEFALSSGSFVAVVGKASAKSAFRVALEWSRPEIN
ncbi:CU044_2847 family protein [Micromonospora sp. NPDC000668]|uniref:CU044_2847 family protein n=1 Tax=Micromonospora sp. NPDC000668 TaxID=3364219 RepID=UPI0036AC9F73